MPEKIPLSEAASLIGCNTRQLMYLIRRGKIDGAEKIGWIWVIPQSEVARLKKEKFGVK